MAQNEHKYPNVAVFGPDGDCIDAMQSTIKLVTASCHEAVDRGDYRQVKALADCLASLQRSLYTMRDNHNR